MEYKQMLKNHWANLSRAVGRDVGSRYTYAIDKDSIAYAFMRMRDELGYPLQIDSKNRRAIVYNKKGVEKKVKQIIDESLISDVKLMEKIIANDIVNEVVSELNNITNINGRVVSKNNNMLSMLSASAVKGIMNGINNIVNDIIKDNNKK